MIIKKGRLPLSLEIDRSEAMRSALFTSRKILRCIQGYSRKNKILNQVDQTHSVQRNTIEILPKFHPQRAKYAKKIDRLIVVTPRSRKYGNECHATC